MFQQYPQHEVNEPILLHEGRFRVRSGDRNIEASGSAHLRWLPRPGIVFKLETDESVGLDLDSVTVELPGFKTKKVVAFSTHWGSTPSGQTRISAFASSMEWGGQGRLLSVGFQIVNFPDVITLGLTGVPGDPTSMTGDNRAEQRPREVPTAREPAEGFQSLTCQTVDLRHDGWRISLVAVRESADHYKHLKATGGYAFTHVGQLTRIDGSAFSVEQAKAILESVRLFLSFARGAACGLPIQWGRGTDGDIVWRWFGSPVVDRWKRGSLSWFDEHHGAILAELFDPFCRRHGNPRLREPLGLALHWYRQCNTNSSGLEGSLVLGMAALDLVGALIVVNPHGSMSAGQYDRLAWAKKLRKLLSALNVQADIPHRYGGLSRFAKRNGGWDSCQALAELRNGFVHANDERRRIVFAPDGKVATPDASQLSLWYQELALLRLLEYRGSYCNRTTAKWMGQVEPVPWSL